MRKIVALLVLSAACLTAAAPAGAVHLYRGPGGGCTPAAGELGESSVEAPAHVEMLHNTYRDGATNAPLTFVAPGKAVRWTWNSEHCHSATAVEFDSGFHYPESEPATPLLLPGVFEYPVPEFEAPTLAYTRTFDEPGVYQYSCVHHAAIGMVGFVVVG